VAKAIASNWVLSPISARTTKASDARNAVMRSILPGWSLRFHAGSRSPLPTKKDPCRSTRCAAAKVSPVQFPESGATGPLRTVLTMVAGSATPLCCSLYSRDDPGASSAGRVNQGSWRCCFVSGPRRSRRGPPRIGRFPTRSAFPCTRTPVPAARRPTARDS
jgi:hypothetical protein